MSEAHETADPDEQLQAEGKEREDENLDPDLHDIGVGDERQEREERRHGKHQPEIEGPRPAGDADRMGAADRFRASEKPVGAHDEDERHEEEDHHEGDLGKDQDPERLELADDEAARKAPGTLPMPPTTVTTNASAMIERSMPVWAGARGLQRSAETGQKRAEEERAREERA